MKTYTKPPIEEIKKKLSKEEFEVTQESGTERPFSNRYWNNKADGIYVDVVTGEPLFSSKDKYDSGTGWPSFTKPIDNKNITTRKESHFFTGDRIEVRSQAGDSHLGHVFDDGPKDKGGKRYCMNSAALKFVPVSQLKELGYEAYLSDFKQKLTPRGLFQTKNAPENLPKTEVASFAAGCFWGVEEEFRKKKGVVATAVGYMGGHTKNPSYEDVCNKETGHAEIVQVEFDPSQITYVELLDLFWNLHNPTTLNRQGPDVGSQYRSAVFTHSKEQTDMAVRSRDKLQASGELGKDKIVTEITAAKEFYKAEDYHQQYVEKGGRAGCHLRK